MELALKFQYYLEEDPSFEVVSTAIDCIKEVTQLVGPLFLEHWLPDLGRSLKKLLDG